MRAEDPEVSGFLFGYWHGADHLRQIAARYPNIRDIPDEKEELMRLDHVLKQLDEHGIKVPTPRTWILQIDEEPPTDLEFPLFVRTPVSSWKRGGDQGKVRNLKQLQDEVELLRRAFGWNVPILARQWLNIAVAGTWMFGKAPQEVRVWIVDKTPVAWSFHYLHAAPNPSGLLPRRILASLTQRDHVDFAPGATGVAAQGPRGTTRILVSPLPGVPFGGEPRYESRPLLPLRNQLQPHRFYDSGAAM